MKEERKKETKKDNLGEVGGMKREKQKFDSKERENLNKRERDGKEINIEHEYIERKTKEKEIKAKLKRCRRKKGGKKIVRFEIRQKERR